MNTLGQVDFLVRGYECGPDGVATLATMMNYLQEAAGIQAEQSGFSKRDFNAAGQDISWVITREHLRMLRYPRWHETARVVTWPTGGRKVVANRDFEVFAGDEKIGYATSEWVLLDLGTRKIVPIPPSVYAAANDERPRAWPDHDFMRLRWDCREIGADAVRLQARRVDIDINRHVNNVHYVEWLLEALPSQVTTVQDFEIAFKSETTVGEGVIAEAVETEPRVYAAHVCAPDGRDHVVARLKTGSC